MVDNPIEELKEIVQGLAKDVDRLQFEFERTVADVVPVSQNFQKYVMDPIEGVIVKFRHLERTVQAIDQANSASMVAMQALGPLQAAQVASEKRISDLERKDAQRKERTRWGIRDVLTPLLSAIITGILLLTVQWKMNG